MKEKPGIRSAVVTAFLAVFGMCGLAWAQDEVEPNYPMSAANSLTIVQTGFDANNNPIGAGTVNGLLDSGEADVYSFWAKEGDVVTFDIDNGIKAGFGPGSVDTYLTVLGPAPTYIWMTSNDDASPDLPLDSNSFDYADPYLANVRIPASGTYYVAVTAYPNNLSDGGVFQGGASNMPGTYVLIVSNVSLPAAPAPDPAPVPAPDPAPVPQVQQINIDIKPGRGTITRIDPRSRRTIPVALLSSKDFDAMKVDESSLTFGHTGDEQSLDRCHERGIDVNRDGRRDKICHFKNHVAAFALTDDHGTVKGKTTDGTQFEGNGPLKVIPHKRKSHNWHGGQRHGRDDDDDDGHRSRRDR